MTAYYEDDLLTLILGDCVTEMAKLPAESVDAVVTDPPYDLTSGKKGGTGAASVNLESPYGRARIGTGNGSGGFMGKAWDSTGIAFRSETWAECFRLAKPGAHLLAFGSTRTYHRMTTAIEDAGWEIRDCLVWGYGSGFPKSLNVSKQPGVCHCGTESQTEHDLRSMPEADLSAPLPVEGEQESVLLAPLPESGSRLRGADGAVAAYTQANVWPSEPGVEGRGDVLQDARQLRRGQVRPSARVGEADGPQGRLHHGAPATDGAAGGPAPESNGSGEPHRPSTGEQRPGELGAVADERGPQARGSWPLCERCGEPKVDGWGTALKPAWEPIVMARKPLIGTVAANVLAHGTGALNIDATRIGTEPWSRRDGDTGAGYKTGKFMGAAGIGEPTLQNGLRESSAGRWPANLILTESVCDDCNGTGAGSLGQPCSTCHGLGSVRIFDGGVPGVVGGGDAGGGFGHAGGKVEHAAFGGGMQNRGNEIGYGDSGTYSRFFLIAKSSRADREPLLRGTLAERDGQVSIQHGGALERWPDGHLEPRKTPLPTRANHHPTVKPLDLMRHLVRLVTPPGGTVLDPFLGSGTTAIAANAEGFRAIGIEREKEYLDIAVARLAHQEIGLGLDVGAPVRKTKTIPDSKRTSPSSTGLSRTRDDSLIWNSYTDSDEVPA
jgi:DNA modification methylase